MIQRRESDIDDIVQRVVTAAANEKNVGEMDLSPLNDVVDVDALHSLLDHAAGPIAVEFMWEGLVVRVSPERVSVGDGRA